MAVKKLLCALVNISQYFYDFNINFIVFVNDCSYNMLINMIFNSRIQILKVFVKEREEI